MNPIEDSVCHDLTPCIYPCAKSRCPKRLRTAFSPCTGQTHATRPFPKVGRRAPPIPSCTATGLESSSKHVRQLPPERGIAYVTPTGVIRCFRRRRHRDYRSPISADGQTLTTQWRLRSQIESCASISKHSGCRLLKHADPLDRSSVALDGATSNA